MASFKETNLTLIAVGRVAGIKKDGGAYYAGAISTDATNRISYTTHGAVKALKLDKGL